MASLHEFNEEVIEALCELGGLSEAEAQSLAASKYPEIEYAHKYRLSPSIIAGSLLGINDCCIPSQSPKS